LKNYSVEEGLLQSNLKEMLAVAPSEGLFLLKKSGEALFNDD
jgi:hypothetical protein